MKGSEFQALRVKAKLSQMDVATRFDRHVSSVWRWESSETVPPMAEYALRWITRAEMPDERAAIESQRQMDHVSAMRDLEEEAHQKRLAEIEQKFPGIFGNNKNSA